MHGKANGAHRPLPREKILYLFSSFFTYTSKYQNVIVFLPGCHQRIPTLFCGQSASKRLKSGFKSVVAVFPHLINSARSYMTLLQHNVPQSIILIRLDVTSSFRKDW